MKPSAEVRFEVPFHDVDMMRVTWHGHYYKYFELARTALFRVHECDVFQVDALGYYLPIIESRCRYIQPLTYGMRGVARATLVESEYRLKVDYLLYEEQGGKRLAKGSTIQVAVLKEGFDLCLVTPTIIADRFRETPANRAEEKSS